MNGPLEQDEMLNAFGKESTAGRNLFKYKALTQTELLKNQVDSMDPLNKHVYEM
jgi:hypothetical protein